MFIQSDLKPEKLDLVMRDEDFVIYYNGNPLLTKGGKEFAHKNSRILKHILVKFTFNSNITNGGISSTKLFSYLKDKIENNEDYIAENFDNLYQDDFLVKAKFGEKHEKLPPLTQTFDFIEKNQDIINLIFWSNSMIIEGFRSLISILESENSDMEKSGNSKNDLKELLHKKYRSLPAEQKSAICLLSLFHRNDLILPIMLVLKQISPSEYANSTLAIHTKFSGNDLDDYTRHKKNSFEIPYVKLDLKNPLGFATNIHHEALKIIEFLNFFSSDQRKISVIKELINLGESDNLEFKSTFRWDIRQNKKNPAIEHASLKTMVAFLNSEGGDLLIGVEDDGKIYGVEADKFPNDDKFLLHLWGLIKTSMGQDVSPYLKTTLEKFDEKTVCRVNCKPSSKPIFLRQKGFDESFYIRIGPSTGSLEISEALKYIGNHFSA